MSSRLERTALLFAGLISLVLTTGAAGDTATRPAKIERKQVLPAQVDLRPQLARWGLPLRKQGPRPTCSIFTAAGALEFAASKHLRRGTVLSVEYLDWAGNQVSRVRDSKSFKDLLKGYEKYGACLEAAMPYLPIFNPEYTPSAEAMNQGQYILSLGLRVHWITPPGKQQAHVQEFKRVLATGYPVAAGSSHSRLVVGYKDDPRQPGGGIFFTKDSRQGYSQITYEFATTKVVDAFWVEVPAPATRPAASPPAALRPDRK